MSDAPLGDGRSHPDEQPVHRRTIELDVYERGGAFDVVGRLQDVRPWADGVRSVDRLHDMKLSVRVRRSDLTITGARAEMNRFPHAECTDIEPAFSDLTGLSVARGYTRAVQERFGRARGCTHLELLARTIGPVVIQAVTSSAARSREGEHDSAEAEAENTVIDHLQWLGDTCHVWRTDGGPGQEKLALGWRPTAGEYPAPSVVELRRGVGRGTG